MSAEPPPIPVPADAARRPRADSNGQLPQAGGRSSASALASVADRADRPADRPVAAGVSGLDRLTLRLGVVVAVVIACCSYAVSATSLYALGRSSGYSWWQSAAVPIIADGPAVYGMFRIVSRSRRDARGAGYGWLLVFAGTAISIAGNVAHAQPGLIARGIAAAIPLAVLAMLEGLKGDAGEVARLAAQPASVDTLGATDTFRPGRPLVDTMTVRRTDAADTGQPVPDGQPVRQLPARPTLATSAEGSVRARLQQAFERGRPDGRVWSARSLAQAAGCGRSAAASFLHALRDTGGEGSS